MLSDTITLARLERQKALIHSINSRIAERASASESVSLPISMLRQEKRLYRRMLGRAPLDVLESHADTSRFT